MQLNWTEVESSNIAALALQDDRMYVRFCSGDIYEYLGVSKNLFDELVSAESIGGAFHKLIRSKADAFPYKKLSLESG